MSKICELSATQLADKIRTKELTAVEISQAFIDRIQEVNPFINAIQQFDPERILREAQNADHAVSTGEKIGKLHGLPITVKDTCHIKGFKCSKGFPGFLKHPSTYNATVIARLKAEGVIILGITNTPELLLSYETDNLIYGRTNNPHDLDRTPGGSSGGEAAIIAAGGSPVGIGSDAGGSIRQPAHYSGICGHKPTQGLVPLTGTIPIDGAGIAAQIASFGPLSRFVEDLTLIMDVISGADQKDPHSPPLMFGNPKTININELRVAYFYNNAETIASDDTVKTLDAVVQSLKNEVASLKESYPESIKDIYRLHWETFILGGDAGESLKQVYKNFGTTQISKLAQQFISQAEDCHFSTKELRQRFVEIEQFRYKMMRFMMNYDVILSPVAATPARLHGETYSNIPDFTYVMIHNLTGWPATVVPCGKSKKGLPIGIQIAAAPWNDHVCLAMAKKLQEIFGIFPIPETQS
ncbi:MAG: amidase [Gammaproteobacteria bacterium]